MRVDRDTAAIVADSDRIIIVKFNFNPVGMACNSLIHRVVQNFGNQMMQRPLIRAANIHARAFAHWLKPFQHLNRRGIVVITLIAA